MSSDEFKEMIGEKVYPKVIVDDLIFDGPIHLTYSDLEPAIKVLNDSEQGANSEWLDEFLEFGLRAAWQDRGYFRVLVEGRADPRATDASHQHFSVILHVEEGPQYRLGTIQFRAVDDSELPESRYAVSLEKHDQASDPEFQDTPDKPTLKKLPSQEDPAKVDSPGKPIVTRRPSEHNPATPDSGEDNPMPPYSGVPPIFPIEQLRRLIPMQDGDILSADKIRQGLEALKDLYGANGYIDFAATPFTEVDSKHQVVDIKMELDENKQYRINKINLVGLDASTQSALVWRLQPGDIFNYDLLKLFFKDNQKLLPEGSSNMNAELRRNAKRGTVDMTLRFSRCASLQN